MWMLNLDLAGQPGSVFSLLRGDAGLFDRNFCRHAVSWDALCYREQWTDAPLDQIGASCCLERSAWLDGCRGCTRVRPQRRKLHARTHTYTQTHTLSLSPSLFSVFLCALWGARTRDGAESPPLHHSYFLTARRQTPVYLNIQQPSSSPTRCFWGLLRRISHSCGDDGASLRARKAGERRGEEERRAPSSASVCQLPLCSPENVNGER